MQAPPLVLQRAAAQVPVPHNDGTVGTGGDGAHIAQGIPGPAIPHSKDAQRIRRGLFYKKDAVGPQGLPGTAARDRNGYAVGEFKRAERCPVPLHLTVERNLPGIDANAFSVYVVTRHGLDIVNQIHIGIRFIQPRSGHPGAETDGCSRSRCFQIGGPISAFGLYARPAGRNVHLGIVHKYIRGRTVLQRVPGQAGHQIHGRYILNRNALPQRHGGRQTGHLPQGHEHGLHPQGAEGDMARRHTYRHKKVVARFPGGNNTSVRNGPRPRNLLFHIAFVLHHPVGDDAPAVVRIHLVGGISNAVRHSRESFTVPLGDDVIRHHPAAFPHIQLWRPMAIPRIFILGKAPPRKFLPGRRRDARVRHHEPEQPQRIVRVRLIELVSPGIRGFQIAGVSADIVGREAPEIVHVGLAPGHGAPNEIFGRCRLRGNEACKQLIARRIIAGRPCKRNPIFQRIRETEPQIIRLQQAVPFAFLTC